MHVVTGGAQVAIGNFCASIVLHFQLRSLLTVFVLVSCYRSVISFCSCLQLTRYYVASICGSALLRISDTAPYSHGKTGVYENFAVQHLEKRPLNTYKLCINCLSIGSKGELLLRGPRTPVYLYAFEKCVVRYLRCRNCVEHVLHQLIA